MKPNYKRASKAEINAIIRTLCRALRGYTDLEPPPNAALKAHELGAESSLDQLTHKGGQDAPNSHTPTPALE